MAVAGLGLLLWARLILISDMPRMALAEPEGGPATLEVDDAVATAYHAAGPEDADAPAGDGSAPR